MKFAIGDYFAPTFGGLLVALILVIIVSVMCGIIRKRKGASYSKNAILVRLWVPVFLFALLSFSTIYALLDVSYLGVLLDKKSETVTVGCIEEIRPAGKLPIYYDKQNRRWGSASYIKVSNTTYYILTDAGLSINDNVAITYCTDGRHNTVLNWTFVQAATSKINSHIQLPISSTNDNLSDFHMPVSQMLLLFGAIIILCTAIRIPFLRKQREFIDNDTLILDGLVTARKIHFFTCSTEILLSVFAILSIFSYNIGFVILNCAGALALWGVRFGVQQTMITYSNNSFSYTTLTGCREIMVSQIKMAIFIRSRQSGFFQLKIILGNNMGIKLEEKNFQGLVQFYNWIVTNPDFAGQLHRKTGDGSLS